MLPNTCLVFHHHEITFDILKFMTAKYDSVFKCPGLIFELLYYFVHLFTLLNPCMSSSDPYLSIRKYDPKSLVVEIIIPQTDGKIESSNFIHSQVLFGTVNLQAFNGCSANLGAVSRRQLGLYIT